MEKEELAKYQVPENKIPSFWLNTWASGDGYDVIERAVKRGYEPIAGWGSEEGYDLGEWPYVIVFIRDRIEENAYDLIVYTEGDVTMYTTPTEELRNKIIDGVAFFYWKHGGEEWVDQYETVDDLPASL